VSEFGGNVNTEVTGEKMDHTVVPPDEGTGEISEYVDYKAQMEGQGPEELNGDVPSITVPPGCELHIGVEKEGEAYRKVQWEKAVALIHEGRLEEAEKQLIRLQEMERAEKYEDPGNIGGERMEKARRENEQCIVVSEALKLERMQARMRVKELTEHGCIRVCPGKEFDVWERRSAAPGDGRPSMVHGEWIPSESGPEELDEDGFQEHVRFHEQIEKTKEALRRKLVEKDEEQQKEDQEDRKKLATEIWQRRMKRAGEEARKAEGRVYCEENRVLDDETVELLLAIEREEQIQISEDPPGGYIVLDLDGEVWERKGAEPSDGKGPHAVKGKWVDKAPLEGEIRERIMRGTVPSSFGPIMGGEIDEKEPPCPMGPIREVCRSLEVFLAEKNKRYGNSVLDPISVFIKRSAEAGILQRMDDKLSRIRQKTDRDLRPGKNDVVDLLGYLVLYCISRQWLSFDELVD